jgi:hypothetical protein
VIKGNRVTGDEEEVPSRLQMLSRFLVDKFKWNQRLPSVDGMEQLSPASVHDNTAFVDEEPTPSMRNCTSVSSFQARDLNNILVTFSSSYAKSLKLRLATCIRIDKGDSLPKNIKASPAGRHCANE